MAGNRRAEELLQFKGVCRKRDEFISASEADIDQKRRENAQNWTNHEEVEEELKEAEQGIQEDRDSLLVDMTEFQEYLEKQDSDEKKEVKLLQMEQDELATQEQQLLNAAEESDEDDDERMRQNLSELLENTPRHEKVLPSAEAVPPDLTNEQLQAELDCVQKQMNAEREQWRSDHLGWEWALNEANQQLAEEETAWQGEAWEQIHYKDTNAKLEKLLHSFKSILSTLQVAPVKNPSARIAEDRAAEVHGDELDEEHENRPEDWRERGINPQNLILGRADVYYTTADMCRCEQERDEIHQRELANVQQQMQSQLHQQQLWFQKELS